MNEAEIKQAAEIAAAKYQNWHWPMDVANEKDYVMNRQYCRESFQSGFIAGAEANAHNWTPADIIPERPYEDEDGEFFSPLLLVVTDMKNEDVQAAYYSLNNGFCYFGRKIPNVVAYCLAPSPPNTQP